MPVAPLPVMSDYRLVVFDLDGTLYRQGPVRRAMLGELLYSGGAPGRLARLRLLRRFRALREELALAQVPDFDSALFAQLARETGRPEAELRKLVRHWMEERPLRHLAPARVAGAAALFDRLRDRGVVLAVWSDYPVAGKLAALGLAADHLLAATDAEVGALKPDPKGLHAVMARTGIAARDTLMVGDRMTHDGAAAAAAGVDFLLRAKKPPQGLGPGQFYLRDYRPLVAQAT
jgi:HAD superfamily hydrolase (TIGR01549 family)|tara:strand:+ start:1789 stop:2487 length:699 start_codon:yes stop_codon:yes gene_type:complete